MLNGKNHPPKAKREQKPGRGQNPLAPRARAPKAAHGHGRWARLASLALALCLGAGLFAGCMPASVENQNPTLPQVPSSLIENSGGNGGPGQPGSGQPAEQPAAAPPEGGELVVMLPSGHQALANLLAETAAMDGITLRLVTQAAGDGYAQAAAKALQEETIDLFWVANSKDAALFLEQDNLTDMAEKGGSPAFAALAQMVPGPARLLDEAKVYGLPVGFHAEGYVVNLELLGALLGTEEYARLQDDLVRCTWEEWVVLVETLQSYLLRPARMGVDLAGTTYTTPAYRPAIAQPLRGMFAVASADAEKLVDSGLDAALNGAFATRQDWDAAANVDRVAAYRPAVEPLGGMLDLETQYMTVEGTAAWRGEDYDPAAAVGAQTAENLFVAGTALFLRADSRQALAIEQENEALANKLALVPVKLSAPLEVEEPGAYDENGEELGEETQKALQEAYAADKKQTEAVAARIEENNARLSWRTDGWLCIGSGAASPRGAQTLLLRLHTTPEGTAAITEKLQLAPFALRYTKNTVLGQLGAAAQSGHAPAAFMGDAPAQAYTALGSWVQENMLTVYEWDTEVLRGFITTMMPALGLPVRIEDLPPAAEEAE